MPEIEASEKRQGLHLPCFRSTAVESKENFLARTPKMPAKCESQAKEHQQHLELAAFYPKIAVAYTQIATISTDDHHTLQEFRASVGAQWTFLSDPERTVQKDLDIAEYTDPEHNPMI